MQFYLLDFHRPRGRKRAGPVHGDGEGVLVAFQRLYGDLELDAGELLRGEVFHDSAGAHGLRLRQRGEDAGILPLRVNEVAIQGDAVELGGQLIAFVVIEEDEAQCGCGAGLHGLPHWQRERGWGVVVAQVEWKRRATVR